MALKGVLFFVIDSIPGDPGGRYGTREHAFAVIGGMVDARRMKTTAA